jgi:putative ABC transport system ATP-binding protein
MNSAKSNPPTLSSPAATAVEVHGLNKSFGDGSARLRVLKDISLSVPDGQILMLVGPSGCGKTTLISIIAGTLFADSGQVEVYGQRVDQLSGSKLTGFRAKNIGFIFQQFNLMPVLSCVENVSVPLLVQGVRESVALKKAKHLLERVGLGDHLHKRPSQLSGGQQQRVAIARGLVHEPRLLICDEPTAALDATNGHLVMELFRDVARRPGQAVILVTHDNRIFPYADILCRMDDGCIAERTSDASQILNFH